MKYACLVYHGEDDLHDLPLSEHVRIVSECKEWIADLERQRKHVFSSGLQCSRTAVTLRANGHDVSMTDGPFAETREVLGGFAIFEARDFNEALAIASRMPCLGSSTVEVRPVMDPSADLTEAFDRKVAAAMMQAATEVA